MDIVSLGEAMVEFFCDGLISKAKVFQKSIGGDTSNTIIAAARLGSKCGYITKVGEDPFTEYLMRKWKSEMIDVSSIIRMANGFNGIYFISLLPEGQREFTYYRTGSAASTITPQDLKQDYIGSARILHTSGISQAISKTSLDTVQEAIHIAKKNGVKVSFDPNYRAKLWTKERALKTYEEILPYVDIALPDESYGDLIHQTNPREIIKYFSRFKIPVIALKLGSKGMLLKTLNEEVRSFGILEVNVNDTTGAGDAFNGGFLHGVCEGYSTDDSALLGTITAGLKAKGRGAVESLPPRKDVYELLKAIKKGEKHLTP
ncbi:MAG: sugar kinase [Candidatus Atabeyarchaeum deiterrae]